MLKTFFLITNCSGMKYWSYFGNQTNTTGNLRTMVDKYGAIYINDKGGFFTPDCVREIHETVTQETFPTWGLDN